MTKSAKSRMAEDLSQLNDGNFANRVNYLLIDSLTIARMWGFYMCDPEMDREKELRNKLTAIWIRALIDAIEGEQRYLRDYKLEAEKRGFKNIALICGRISEYFQCVRSLLSQFNKEEQIFLFYVRNSLVHGWNNAEHAPHINIKYFDGSKVQVERLERKAFWKLKHEFFGNSNVRTSDLDCILAPLTERLKADTKYWAVLANVLSDEFTRSIEHGIATDLGVRLDRIKPT